MLFFTDIDNTVIYSHRHPHEGPAVWVEAINGKKQSYVSERVFQFYSAKNPFRTVPLTTRALRQYLRLWDSFAAFGWEDALIYNGAVLLRNGAEDAAWTQESLEISREERRELARVRSAFEGVFGARDVVAETPFLFYVKTDAVPEVMAWFLREADPAKIRILRNSRRVYCIPASMSKGTAAERYRQRFGYDGFIAAGDSEFDISMLEKADIALCPAGMSGFAARGRKLALSGVFADRICDELEKLAAEFALNPALKP
jgi:hypothetical protein